MSLFDIETTYWNSKGKYQKAYDHFHSKLVPPRGYASTPEGELFVLWVSFTTDTLMMETTLGIWWKMVMNLLLVLKELTKVFCGVWRINCMIQTMNIN